MIDRMIYKYCRDLLHQSKEIRRYAWNNLDALGPSIVPVLEKIILCEGSASKKDWNVLVGAVCTLNHYSTSINPLIRKYQDNLNWLPEEHGRCDLHIHTELSDGKDSIAEIMQKSVKRCVKVISICDHNAMDGIRASQRIGKTLGIRVIPSCEIAAHMKIDNLDEHEWLEVHFSGYFLNPVSNEVKAFLRLSQCRTMLLDILIANQIISENQTRLADLSNCPIDIFGIILEANKSYAKRLERNNLKHKAKVLTKAIQGLYSSKSIFKKELASLINNITSHSNNYKLAVSDIQLLEKMIQFSGFMFAEPMNNYINTLTKIGLGIGDWFSEIKKREQYIIKYIPKVSPEMVINKIYKLGGIPVLAHPTWYIVKYLRRYRKEYIAKYNNIPTWQEEEKLQKQALEKGLRVIKKIDTYMPNGLHVLDLYHWSYDTEFNLEEILLKLADEYKMTILSGSDYHGLSDFEEYPTEIGTGANHNICGRYAQVLALEALKSNH